jgi:hypothetical protein
MATWHSDVHSGSPPDDFESPGKECVQLVHFHDFEDLPSECILACWVQVDKVDIGASGCSGGRAFAHAANSNVAGGDQL